MLAPSIFFAFVLASLYAALFYLFFGQGWARLGLYWVASVLGFAVGNWLGSLIGLSLFTIGPVNVVEATLVSFASLFAARAWRRT